MPAKIAINGYGTIGKRVADAVSLQDDMKIVGVAKTKPNFEAKLAAKKGYPVYASDKDSLAKFQKAGFKTAGTLEDLVKEADLVTMAENAMRDACRLTNPRTATLEQVVGIYKAAM